MVTISWLPQNPSKCWHLPSGFQHTFGQAVRSWEGGAIMAGLGDVASSENPRNPQKSSTNSMNIIHNYEHNNG